MKTIEEARKYYYGHTYGGKKQPNYKEGYCIKAVYSTDRFPIEYQCTRKIWKDGFCKQHHPNTVAERQKKQEERWKTKLDNSPWVLLGKAQKRIKELEEENAELKKSILAGQWMS